ncbi:MAG: GNAT family N-acetyltransferase [Tepidiformaceae bacterium]
MTASVLTHATDQEEPFRSLRGHALHIRPLSPGDREDLAQFVRALSPRSRRLRFFSPLKNLDPARLEHFIDLDFHDRAAFVATLDGVPGVQAVGRYERTTPDSAEVAFSVADELQGEGIGTELLDHLAAHARHQGITNFTAYVLLENQQMFEVFRHCGYPMSAEYQAGVSLVTLALGDEARTRAGHRYRSGRASPVSGRPTHG